MMLSLCAAYGQRQEVRVPSCSVVADVAAFSAKRPQGVSPDALRSEARRKRSVRVTGAPA